MLSKLEIEREFSESRRRILSPTCNAVGLAAAAATHPTKLWHLFRICYAIFVVAAHCATARADVAADLAQLAEAYKAKLNDLAASCEEQKRDASPPDAAKLDELAKIVRGWTLPEDELTLCFALPGSQPLVIPAEVKGPARRLWIRFHDLRREQAAALFELIYPATKEGLDKNVTDAYVLFFRVLREDPDHTRSREALGYKLEDGRWRTPYEVTKAFGKQIWDDRYGWQLRDRLERYEKGERFYRGHWLSAAEEARQVTDLASGWEVTTEHFAVRTDHSLEAGVALAARLERFYLVWQQLFAGYRMKPTNIFRSLGLQGRRFTEAPMRHAVSYYRNRDEYVAALVKKEPNIAVTTGYYDPDARVTHFFAGPGEDISTIYHEATHQFFYERRESRAEPGLTANFWIVEGAACYLESLVEHDGYVTVGGADTLRLKAARYRCFEDDCYVPLAEFTTFGRKQMQHDARLQQFYSQAAGLTHFLVHFERGRYRNALMQYLGAVYTGHDRPETLAELTGTPYPELDAQYRAWLKTTRKLGF
jgi:hypothetical protein